MAKEKIPRLRPKKNLDANVKHGIWALDRLLKCDLDGRLAIVKKRDRLEADLIDYCGGTDRLSPPLISIIKRIVHKELVAQHSEKMALLGDFNLGEKQYLALSNSLRLDIMALQQLLDGSRNKRGPSLEDYIAEVKSREQLGS